MKHPKLLILTSVLILSIFLFISCDSNGKNENTNAETNSIAQEMTDSITQPDEIESNETDSVDSAPEDSTPEDGSSDENSSDDESSSESSSDEAPEHIHTVTTDAAVAPTCTETGLTEGSHCSECNEIITAQNTVPALGHTVAIYASAIAPTCTETGVSEGKRCSVCHITLKTPTTISALGHNWNNEYVCTLCTAALIPTEGLEYRLRNNGTEYEVSGIGTATATDIVIPYTYNDLPVTRIADYAFENCESIESIIIPDSVTHINRYAFAYCENLESITIPDSVTIINARAFYGSPGIKSITVDSSNTTFHSDGNCLIKTARNTLIWGCQNSIIPTDGSVTTIGDYAFSGCGNLESITIPNSVTTIGYYAFSGCSNLESITIPNSITTIESGAIDRCSSLTDIIFKGTKAQWDAVNKDSQWDINAVNYTIYCTDGIITPIQELAYTLINDGTEYEVSGIGSITSNNIVIPSTYKYLPVTRIGNQAFYTSLNLTSITIPSSITSIGYKIFSALDNDYDGVIDISSLESIYFQGTKAQWEAIIKDESWDYYTGDYTVYCTDGIITPVQELEYTLINDGTEYAVSGIGTVTATDIIIPYTYNNRPVTSIGEYAFHYCTSLTSITIPDSVTSIGSGAFYNCTSLDSITIPNSITTIGTGAIAQCSSLTDVFFKGTQEQWNLINKEPEWDIDSDNYTIYGTDGIIIPVQELEYTLINDGTEYEVSGIGSITSNDIVIPSTYDCRPVTRIATYAFTDCSNLKSVIISNGIKIIADYAFMNCTNLTDISIPGSVTDIYDHAFANCSKLASITIPDGLADIGYCSFRGCTSIESINIPESVTSLWYSAFVGCSNLESITVDPNNTVYHASGNCLIKTNSGELIACAKNGIIPTDGSVTIISSGAFCDVLNIESISIPDTVTGIDFMAFDGCTSLTSITIPDSVTWIGDWAFSSCTSLTSITFEGTQEQWNAIRKELNWNADTGNYTIYCTDGTITK